MGGVTVTVTVAAAGAGPGFRADSSSPAYAAMASAMREAYDGTELAVVGQGGSIPAVVSTLAGRYPRAEILMVGLSDTAARIHAMDESVCPDELRRMAVAGCRR